MVALFNEPYYNGYVDGTTKAKLITKATFQANTHPNIKDVFNKPEYISKYKWLLEYIAEEVEKVTKANNVYEANMSGGGNGKQFVEWIKAIANGDTTKISETGYGAGYRTALRQFISRLMNYNDSSVTGNAEYNQYTVDYANNATKVKEFQTLYNEYRKNELIKVVVNEKFENGTYITNNSKYPDPTYYGLAGKKGLKMQYVNQAVLSNSFDSTDKVFVKLDIFAINENSKTSTSTDVFKVVGLNANGEEVATEMISSLVKTSDGYTAYTVLSGEGITQVKVQMVNYYYNGTKYCNINFGGFTVEAIK